MQLLSAIRQQRRARCDIALAVVWFALSTKALEGSSLRGGQRESPKLFPSQRPCWEPSQPMAVVSSHASPTSVIDTVARPVRVLASHWPAFCPPPFLVPTSGATLPQESSIAVGLNENAVWRQTVALLESVHSTVRTVRKRVCFG